MKDTYRGVLRRNEWDGPFALMVAAPSGRRPWPIETKSSQDDYVEGKPIQVSFTYPVHFVPAGKRSVRVARARDRAPVMLKTTCGARLGLAGQVRPMRPDREATEIMHDGQKLWWSLPGRPTVQRFAAALTEGEHAAVGLLDQKCVSSMRPANSREELGAREIVYDGRDDCVTRLQRGVEGLVASMERSFSATGPLYTSCGMDIATTASCPLEHRKSWSRWPTAGAIPHSRTHRTALYLEDPSKQLTATMRCRSQKKKAWISASTQQSRCCVLNCCVRIPSRFSWKRHSGNSCDLSPYSGTARKTASPRFVRSEGACVIFWNEMARFSTGEEACKSFQRG